MLIHHNDIPPKERTLKPDYETVGSGKRKRRVKSKTVQNLHEGGDISGEAVTASEHWLTDYLFAEHGYADYLGEPLPHDYLIGDVHTFALARGQAAARIAEVRDALGLCSHIRLQMLLADGLSFSALGEQLWPEKGRSERNTHARAQCALLLEQLAFFYVEKHKNKVTKNSTCTLPASMP